MLTKKQIERIEDKLNTASAMIASHLYVMEKIAEDDSISEDKKNASIEMRTSIIHDKRVRIDTITDMAFVLGFLVKVEVGDDGVSYYHLERF